MLKLSKAKQMLSIAMTFEVFAVCNLTFISLCFVCIGYYIVKTKMECEELLEQLLVPGTPTGAPTVGGVGGTPTDDKREKLVALAVGGKAKHYFGDYTPDKIHKMSAEEIDKLYARYESRLGAEMTKTIGSAMTQIYTGIASYFLPIPPERRLYLWEDLEKDPFIEHAVSSISCGLYHKYGMLLAPVTAAIITAKHCQFERKNNNNSIDGGGNSEGTSGGDPHTPNSWGDPHSDGTSGGTPHSNQAEEESSCR